MDYHQKLVDQALLTMDTYLGQFPDIKVRGCRVALMPGKLERERGTGQAVRAGSGTAVTCPEAGIPAAGAWSLQGCSCCGRPASPAGALSELGAGALLPGPRLGEEARSACACVCGVGDWGCVRC